LLGYFDKKQLSRHKKSKRHLDYINQKSLDLTNDDKEPEEAEISNDEASEAEEEEVVEVKEKPAILPKGQTRNSNKFHLDAIRQKAIAKIKEKKQAKIDKEMEIIKKAEQYDDKMIKNQEKNNAIKTLSNEKIIDSVKQQRLEYLLRYLQNPNQY